MTDAVLTTTNLEVVHKGNPNARLTTTTFDVIHGGSPKARVSTSSMEVIYSIASAGPAFKRRVVTVITS